MALTVQVMKCGPLGPMDVTAVYVKGDGSASTLTTSSYVGIPSSTYVYGIQWCPMDDTAAISARYTAATTITFESATGSSAVAPASGKYGMLLIFHKP